ncbi:ATPase domain protein, prokaryote domain protein [Candidatus Magnetomorum sp. HK-1]|nr:ATPase domain protein, prokaryote domain protein [Candidatus Magnetomorum sp. HK-1]
MRTFHSYGPINTKKHYYVPRNKLVEKCIQSLVGDPDDLGHYFTIWGTRQTGKTWLYRQSLENIKHHYGDQFIVGEISMQSIVFNDNGNQEETFFNNIPDMFEDEYSIQTNKIQSWIDWKKIFSKKYAAFDRPLILVIDEFDKLPPKIIDNLVSLFREMYLNRKAYMLHALALVGVRAVLGIESKSGSPFNVQRSLHIDNLSFDEVKNMFDQYQEESKKHIEPDVIETLYEKTQGQPGLIGWFGELLTEKYNQKSHKTIDITMWNHVYLSACEIEHNNTVQNMISKARNEFKSNIINLFTDSNVHFSFHHDWCNYMYMHGLIGYKIVQERNQTYHMCCFSSPFIQTCLYNALVGEIKELQERSMLALDPLDTLDDVFNGHALNIPALLRRYKDFLKRMKDRGENPWTDQPRRKSDYHLTEAVGHFHLYHWLCMALRKRCTIRPEFPTGNGKVDLHLLCKDNKKGLIEVKSFVNAYEVKEAISQAAKYASKTDHESISIAMFAPFTDEQILSQLSVTETINDVIVNVVAIGQG